MAAMASEVIGDNMHMDTRWPSWAIMAIMAIMALEAIMASEAIGGNMHMDTRVIMVADVKSEVI